MRQTITYNNMFVQWSLNNTEPITRPVDHSWVWCRRAPPSLGVRRMMVWNVSHWLAISYSCVRRLLLRPTYISPVSVTLQWANTIDRRTTRIRTASVTFIIRTCFDWPIKPNCCRRRCCCCWTPPNMRDLVSSANVRKCRRRLGRLQKSPMWTVLKEDKRQASKTDVQYVKRVLIGWVMRIGCSGKNAMP